MSNYYDTFIQSLLAIEPKTRNVLLKAATAVSPDNSPFLYLFQAYNDMDNPLGQFLKAMLDEYKLAID
jgi:hypothetical protein